jgi:hypothetical protein
VINPRTTGSRALSVTFSVPRDAVTPNTASGNTAFDSLLDNHVSSDSSFYQFASYLSTNGLTAGHSFTAGSTSTGPGSCAAVELQSTGTIVFSTTAPPPVSGVSAGFPVTSVTTAGFTPPANSLLLALVSAASDPFGSASMSITDTAGLEWTELVSANTAGNGYAGIWAATAPAAVAASTASLPQGTVGLGYATTLAAGGGYAPYTWQMATAGTVTPTTIPVPAPGLYLYPDGTIRGVPTTPGIYSFTAQATDASGAVTSVSLSLTVGSVPASGVQLTGSWMGKAASYTYGTLTIPVANADHDWLIVTASWEDGEDPALAFICDDRHNWYNPAYYTTTGTIRTMAWVCSNAAATKKIYVSTSAFVHWLTVSVHSFTGLGSRYFPDVVGTTGTDGPGKSFVMTLNPTAADFMFASAAFAGGVQAIGVTGTGAAWHHAGSHSNGNGTEGVSQATAWAVTNGAGTVTTTFTDPQLHTYSGGMIGLKFGLPALNAPNLAWPRIQVEAAFGYPVGNPRTIPTWTNITNRFLGLSGQRGRSFELDELTASDLTLTLDNVDGVLTPFNQRTGFDFNLMTPIRIWADWQGRRYNIFQGLTTAIPQTFDFQRGILKLSLTDDYAKLPQILLPSCMISELLYDDPLDLWPLNDAAGAKFASNWSGRSTETLVPVNAKYGPGIQNNQPNTGFGNNTSNATLPVYPAVLMGTTDTVWGNYTNLASGTLTNGKANPVHGTALAARDYAGLPLKGTGGTYEVWALPVNTAINWATGATLISIGDDKGSNGGGNFLTLTIPAGKESGNTYTAGAQVIVVSQGDLSSNATHSFKFPAGVNPWSGWHHYAVQVSPAGVITVYVDGKALGSFTGKFPSGKANWISFGGDPKMPPNTIVGGTSKGVGQAASVAGLFMGYLANAVIYDRAIDPQRILAHYQSGATGFVGETAGLRIQRLLTYAHWAGPQAIEPGVSRQQQLNYLGQGYASSGLSGAIGQYATTGGGFSDQGAQVDVTMQDVAAGELGFLFVGSDGTLTFRQRVSNYNKPQVAVIGDMDFAINAPHSTWVANGGDACTVELSTDWSYAGGESALLTVTGGAATAQPRTNPVPVVPGDTVGGSAWVMSPQGCYVYLALDFKDSSGTNLSTTDSLSVWCPPLTPVQLQIPLHTVPSGCASVTFHPVIDKNPAAGIQLFCDRVRLSPGGLQVPYNDDLEINVDVQYLYNDVVITRNYDQATYRAVNNDSRSRYFPRVFTRTIYTDLADTEAVVDIAQWLIADYASPHIRVSRVTVNPAVNPDAWPFVLGTDIGDLVGFERNPVGGDPISGTFQILSIEADIEKDKAEFTYVLAPVVGSGVLTLDDPVFGLIGNKLAL